MKEENENILFNFYWQVLVVVITEIQIQLYKSINIKTTHPFSLTFSTNYFSFDCCMSIPCVFVSSDKPKNISCRVY